MQQILSQYFDFLCQFSFHLLPYIYQAINILACTIGPLEAAIPNGLGPTPRVVTNTKRTICLCDGGVQAVHQQTKSGYFDGCSIPCI
jgi:hypothetical protein